MMGVYIKGMDMPKSCFYCPFREKVNPDDYVCLAMNKEFEETFSLIVGNRHKDCPLVPVPPHGRLIEDVAVREQIDEWLDSVGDVVVGRGLSYYGELLGCIKDAPTVIPASEEGE